VKREMSVFREVKAPLQSAARHAKSKIDRAECVLCTDC